LLTLVSGEPFATGRLPRWCYEDLEAGRVGLVDTIGHRIGADHLYRIETRCQQGRDGGFGSPIQALAPDDAGGSMASTRPRPRG